MNEDEINCGDNNNAEYRNDPEQTLLPIKCRKLNRLEASVNCVRQNLAKIFLLFPLKRELDFKMFRVIHTVEAGFSNSVSSVQIYSNNFF